MRVPNTSISFCSPSQLLSKWTAHDDLPRFIPRQPTNLSRGMVFDARDLEVSVRLKLVLELETDVCQFRQTARQPTDGRLHVQIPEVVVNRTRKVRERFGWFFVELKP